MLVFFVVFFAGFSWVVLVEYSSTLEFWSSLKDSKNSYSMDCSTLYTTQQPFHCSSNSNRPMPISKTREQKWFPDFCFLEFFCEKVAKIYQICPILQLKSYFKKCKEFTDKRSQPDCESKVVKSVGTTEIA